MEPVFDATTERVYGRLPAVYRSEDAQFNWPLKRWLAGICGVLNQVETLLDRFSYVPPEEGRKGDTSDLVDPMKADVAWLSWLAQLVGVQFAPDDNTATRRTKIASSLSGTKAGTVQAMIEVVKGVLTGGKSVFVYKHSTAAGVGTGTQWDVLILTVESETLSDPIAAITSAGVKPAGIKLHHSYFGASWATIESQRPTWADWEAVTWQKLEETGI